MKSALFEFALRSGRVGLVPLFVGLLLGACSSEEDDLTPAEPDSGTADVAPEPDVATEDTSVEADVEPRPIPTWDSYTPPAAPIPRLTSIQLRNAWRDLLGEDVVIPRVTMPDLEDDGLIAVGASEATLAPRSVEDIERAAPELARQIVEPERRSRLGDCEPADVRDDACAREILTSFGRRAWRRPLLEEELAPLVELAGEAALNYGDFWLGLRWPLAAVLQSPHLLFRREVGEPGEDGQLRYNDWEMASRLSFLLWNTIPDDTLLDEAAAGLLTTDEGLRTALTRMRADERARNGLLEYFRQYYGLTKLDYLSKDPGVFPAMSPELGPAALEETEAFLWGIIQDDLDFHDVLLSNRTYIDRRLAALYGVQAPAAEGFGWTELPESTGRRGLLGQASFLLIHSHPSSTSATGRGMFIRERLLCLPVPPPPANIDTSIPEPDENARTLRERMQVHQEDPTCAGCHRLTDPMGLAFEAFDGLGMFRTTENGATIDTSGELEGAAFADSWELADVLAAREEFAECVVQSFMRFATGTVELREQRAAVLILTAAFTESGYRFNSLVEALVLSPAFRNVGAPAAEEASE
jgi:hypothetical protein